MVRYKPPNNSTVMLMGSFVFKNKPNEYWPDYFIFSCSGVIFKGQMCIAFFANIINLYDPGVSSKIIELASFCVIAILVYKYYVIRRIVIGRLLSVTVFAFYRWSWRRRGYLCIYGSDVLLILLV